MPERLAVAPMTATPATASPAWRLQHVSFEKLTCSYFGPVADQIVIVGQLQVLRDAEIEATTRAGLGHASRGDLRQSMSGDGWRARLKSDASGVQIDKPGVGGQIQECASLGPQQIRRCRDHHRVGQRHDGADCAVIGRLAVGPMIGAGLRPNGARCVLVRSSAQCVQMRGRKTTSAVKARLLRIRQGGRRLRAAAVEMAERQQTLDRQRKKREPRPKPDV